MEDIENVERSSVLQNTTQSSDELARAIRRISASGFSLDSKTYPRHIPFTRFATEEIGWIETRRSWTQRIRSAIRGELSILAVGRTKNSGERLLCIQAPSPITSATLFCATPCGEAFVIEPVGLTGSRFSVSTLFDLVVVTILLWNLVGSIGRLFLPREIVEHPLNFFLWVLPSIWRLHEYFFITDAALLRAIQRTSLV